MIADMLIPASTSRSRPSSQFPPKPHVSNFAAATQYRYRPTPVLTIVDMNSEDGTASQGDNPKQHTQPSENEDEAPKFSKLPSCLHFQPEPKNVRIMNLAEGLDLTPTMHSNRRKSSVKIKHKTLEWVVNQSHFLTRKTAESSRLGAPSIAAASEVSLPQSEFCIQQASNIPTQEFNFSGIEDATNPRYKSLTGARADLNSAFSSIPWCYHGANVEATKVAHMPADNSEMPNQLYVRSVGHLQKAHRTGISRPGSTTQSKTSTVDEIDELKRMSTPILHQAVREAVSLGLMSVHESQVLLDVITRKAPKDWPASSQPPKPDTEETAAEPAPKEQDHEPAHISETPLHMIGMCDPTVGFEPVDITYKAPSPVPPQQPAPPNNFHKKPIIESEQHSPALSTPRTHQASVSEAFEEHSDSDGIDFGIIGKDELKANDTMPGTPRSPSEETPGCIARPCTAAESTRSDS